MLKIVSEAIANSGAEGEGDNEWVELAEKGAANLDYLVKLGVFKKGLSEAQRAELSSPLAYHILEDMVITSKAWRDGDFPRPGQPLMTIEFYGLFECFYRSEYGIVFVDRLDDPVFRSAPIIRLHLNGVLVGLSILGELVLDYYSDYLEWLAKQGQGVTFTF